MPTSKGSMKIYLRLIAASLACLANAHGHRSHETAQVSLLPIRYQATLIAKTAHLRPGPHSYAGYSGPWLENQFFEAWQKQPDRDPIYRLYLPIAWTDCLLKGNLRDEMQSFLTELDMTYSYYTVVQADLGFEHPDMRLSVPEDLDLVLYSAGGDSLRSNGHVKVIPVPLLKEELKPVGIVKNVAVSSQGSATHFLRQKLDKMYNKDFLFLSPSPDWKTILETSIFAFAPRGFGATSFRMYEALQLGTIPIYVWEDMKWLPFQEIINWNSFAVIVEGAEISTLRQRIKNADAKTMQAELHKYRHMFTYNYTIQYIVDHASYPISDKSLEDPRNE